MSRVSLVACLSALAASCAVYQTADVCEPGETEACACVGDAVGERTCLPGGRGWGDCECTCAYAWCSGECTDTSADRDNCGGCDVRCAGDEVCERGRCIEEDEGCLSGLTRCGEACVDLGSDPDRCRAMGEEGRRLMEERFDKAHQFDAFLRRFAELTGSG